MRNVLDWLETSASTAPEAPAFVSANEMMTWSRIRSLAKRIGTVIAGAVPAQSPVLILEDKSPMCVAAMLGAVYAGCFYTPVDASMPRMRMQCIADVLQPRVILCGDGYAQMAGMLARDAAVFLLSEIPENIGEGLLAGRRADHVDTDLLYVLFTSGSTGVPKGVSVCHRSVIDFVEWACEALRLPTGLRFGSQAPFYFDNSVLDIYCSMRMAGSLYLIPRGDFLFPKKMLQTLKNNRIDTIFWVPSALSAMADAQVLCPGCLPDMKRVFFCGEVMPCRTLNIWRRALPEADHVNMYGPTEITDVCTWYRVDREFSDTDKLPIGVPCANTRVFLLDGEICVTGTCLALGYYRAPEKTSEVFVQNPLRPEIRETIYKTGDMAEYNHRGELMFLGRRDSQIKRNGYRIELGEIECALCAAEGVASGCCWYDAAAARIMAVYSGQAGEKEVKAFLKTMLPKYMMPDVLLQRQALPKTGSGKIDRAALRREVEHGYTVL